MEFSIQKELFDLLPGLVIGVVVAMNVDNTRPSDEVGDLLDRSIETMKREFGVDKAQDHPRIKPWRAAFSGSCRSGRATSAAHRQGGGYAA